MTTTDAVLVSDPVPGVRLITLNRPEAFNAINMAMAARLVELLNEAGQDDGLSCLVISGAGDRAFSAGFDIKEMAGFDPPAMRDAFVKRDPLMLQIATHRLPVIAALNGLAHGAGALIAAACDFRIACERSDFRVTAINYGSANATWSLPRLVGASRAKDIIMTGRRVGPEEGLRIGLFDRLCDADALNAEVISFAGEIAAKPRGAVLAAKQLVDGSLDSPFAEAWHAEHKHVLSSLAGIGQPGSELFSKFLDARKPNGGNSKRR